MREQLEKLIEGQKTMIRMLSREPKHELREEGKEGRASVDHTEGKFEIHLIDKLQQQQRVQAKVSFLIVDSKACLVEDLNAYDEIIIPMRRYRWLLTQVVNQLY
jgi:hypothetical protein